MPELSSCSQPNACSSSVSTVPSAVGLATGDAREDGNIRRRHDVLAPKIILGDRESQLSSVQLRGNAASQRTVNIWLRPSCLPMTGPNYLGVARMPPRRPPAPQPLSLIPAVSGLAAAAIKASYKAKNYRREATCGSGLPGALVC